ncbi:MAG: GDSL-type esterase/lipase family protein [Bacteroidales bacterium]
MRKFLLASFLTISLCSFAQERTYSTYWHQRATLFEILPIHKKDIVFVGNSITDGGEWSELFNNPNVKNRGISGDVSMGVYDRLDAIVKGKPKKIFLLIGVNDLARGTSIDTIANNIALVIDKIKQQTPGTKIYLQSVLPVTDEKNMFSGHTSRGAEIAPLNLLLQQIAVNKSITYIDLYTKFIDPETGKLNVKYSNDGLHLLGAGYQYWATIVKPYISEK